MIRPSTITIALLLGLIAAPLQAAPLFSLDPPSPTVVGGFVLESDVLAPGPIGGPPVVGVTAAAIGLVGGGVDNVNAMSAGGATGQIHFSVDRASVGVGVAAPDVLSESGVGQAAGDIYVGSVMPAAPVPPAVGANQLAYNQDVLGLLPAILPGVAAVPPIDDVDALDLQPAPGPPLFALTGGHPYAGSGVGCGSDIFLPGLGLAIGAPVLGLLCADDIDALHIDMLFSAGDVYFSLAPGSPSLLPGSGIPACVAAGCSAADIFVAIAGVGPPLIAFPFTDLGLLGTDNVDALAMQACPTFIGVDADGDGIDDGCDNCSAMPNPTQWDADVDGFGNQCDSDYQNDLLVGIPDFGILLTAFATALGGPGFVPACDHNLDGFIGIPDLAFYLPAFAGPPGPSTLPCAGVPPCTD